MTNQKRRKKSKTIFLIYTILLSFFMTTIIKADMNNCKKFDMICKSTNWIEKTKNFQKEKFKEGKNQLGKTKDKIIKGVTKNKK